ncbi:MAG: hypothetical protein AAFY34_00940 [Pseudomonadota bacterium]
MIASANRSDTAFSWMTGALFVLAVGALFLRFATNDSAQYQHTPSSPYTALAETFVGAGNVRVGDTGSGDIIVLLNTDRQAGRNDPAITQDITDMIEAMAPGRSVTIKDAPFSRTSAISSEPIFILEILALILMSGISGWLFIALQRRRQMVPADDPVPANDIVPRPSALVTALAKPASPIDKAADFAERQPARTADIITGWLSDEDKR